MIAAAAVVVLWIDPSHVQSRIPVTYLALATFCGYSLLMYAATAGRLPRIAGMIGWSHWADLAWVTALVGLSGATQSIFFIGYFFAILTASFRWGFASGALVTLSSFVLYAALGYLLLPDETPDIGRALVRPVYLLVLGYMIAYWGGFHVSLTGRLRLLKDVIAVSNPRFGVDRTVANVMRRLQAFYHADACMLLKPVPSGDGILVWRTWGRWRRATRTGRRSPTTSAPHPRKAR